MLTINFEKAIIIDIIRMTGNKIALNMNLILIPSLYLFVLYRFFQLAPNNIIVSLMTLDILAPPFELVYCLQQLSFS